MIKNYLKIAIRTLRKRPFYSGINVFGLALGMCSAMFITLYVLHELSYDQFHRYAERVFRVTTNEGKNYHLATTPAPLAGLIRQDIPEVEAVARVFTWNHSTMRLPDQPEKVFRETSIYIADSTFLDVLDFNLIAGSTRALDAPDGLVLTKATAERYFGKGAVERDEVLGKEILFGGSRAARVVSGVVDPPSATHFPFDMLVATTGYDEFTEAENWGWNIMYTYLKLSPGVAGDARQMAAFQDKLDQLVAQYVRPAFSASSSGAAESDLHYEIQAVTDIHLHSDLVREHQANGSLATVYTLVGVAILILLLACINFVNLSTAQASQRAREVGVRKALGSSRKRLVFQFLLESMLVTLLAVLIALAAVEALRIPFNTMTGKELNLYWWQHPEIIFLLAGAVLLVGLLAGSYPAFYLSAFRPVRVLKGNIHLSLGGGLLRNLLIVFQFAVTISLIITTGLVMKQLNYIQSKDIGYDRENVLIIKNDKEIQDRWKDFKAALLNLSSVKKVSFTTGIPSQPIKTVRDFRKEEENQGNGIHWYKIDADYIATLGLEIVAGRGFEENRASDQKGILLNEDAVRDLGLVNPVGEYLIKNQGEEDEERLRVIGIVKNFHTESFDRQVKSLAIQYFTPSYLSDYVAVRFRSGDVQQGLSQVEEVWSQFEPDNPFVYSFLDQDFDRMFRAESRLGKVLGVFTVLAIVVACMGLLGLTSFIATQRTKEIGVRKVLGASVSQITLLLSKDFIRLVIISFVVAAPLSYWLASQWLEQFVYRTNIGLGIFVLAGFSACLIAWLTISFQSVKAARANPVNSLRNE